MRIYKYHIAVDDMQEVRMPTGAEILCVQIQGMEPFVWARVDPDAGLVKRTFRWRGTGHPCDCVGQYVGTVQMRGGLVFHLFVDREP
jgi:hypothetical protein